MLRRRRGPEGGAGPRGPRRDPAGPGGRTSRPLSSASGVAGPSAADRCSPRALAPIPRPASPHLLRSSRSAARPPRSRPLSARPPGFQRPAAPSFPRRRLGKVDEEEEEAEEEEEEEEAATT